jgi:small subunit ribosomal protein S4
MGKPKFSRKKYETPSHPWEMERIKEENELIKKYGLKNKREVWKAETRLRKYRGQARGLLAKIGTDAQSKKESDQLIMHLNRMNILPPNSTLDDVLTLDTEAILSRRLQTITYLKGLASTPQQSRQLIAHGHISIGDKKVTIPGYMVTKDEEANISYIPNSPLNDAMHPARPKGEFASVPLKKKEKTEEEKPTEEQKPKEEKPEKPADKEQTKEESAKDEEEAKPPEEKKEDVKEETVEEKTDDTPSDEKKEETNNAENKKED